MQPTHKTRHSAGADVCSSKTLLIHPGQIAVVNTDAFVPDSMPDNSFLLLAIRSSLAKKGLIIANGVGIIDADYPGEIGVMLSNVSDWAIEIKQGERIAQLIPMRFLQGIFPVENKTRLGGFGSTN